MAKLKPILFNTAMVQKIMAGEKTETRRVVLPQPEGARFVLDCDEENQTFDLMCGNNGAGGIFCDWAETVKPKFWFGDVLYIRETWRVQSAHRFEADAKIEFRAGGPLGKIQFPGGCSDSESREAFDQFIAKWSTDSKWNPSIFMPKEAARTFLKIVDVSVERLGDINGGGLKAEGIDRKQPCAGGGLRTAVFHRRKARLCRARRGRAEAAPCRRAVPEDALRFVLPVLHEALRRRASQRGL